MVSVNSLYVSPSSALESNKDEKVPGLAIKLGAHPVGYQGFENLYSFSWFFVCTTASVIYFAMSFIGDYAKEERSMPFEALVFEQAEILNGLELNSPSFVNVTEFNIDIEKRV